MSSLDVVNVADGVHLVSGQDVNWILLVDGDDVTMIDSGYPGYVGQVISSLEAVGRRPEDVRAILLTHAHIDHVGGAAHFASEYSTPVLTSEVEVGHARRDYLEQLGPTNVVRNIHRPGVLSWTMRIVRAGGMKTGAVPSATQFGVAQSGVGGLDLPGAPVPVASPGHTSGHTGYFLPSVGVVATGDALITGHALTSVDGPQLLPPFFSHDPKAEFGALDAFVGLGADIVLPGHGPVHRGDIAAAVDTARERAK